MSILYIVGAVLSVALFVYLLFAMLTPEKFS
ncbi:MAG TPA: K(+)-transporting ATPase subunit F [Polyangiaceae bacterium]